jgi:site-specific DNA-methyltransferase (adenine-specific)
MADTAYKPVQVLQLRHGDCVEVLGTLADASVGAIVCDPPYGLEFFGEGIKLDWQRGGGFAKPGIGDRDTAWPSFSATSKHGMANPTCAVCGGRLRGAKKCGCPKPHDHWKPIGKRRNPENESLPDHMTGSGMTAQLNAMQDWHAAWLSEAYRVLTSNGVVLAFSATRTCHRMATAFEEVGFVEIGLEAWCYGSGFPKSMDISKALDKQAGVARTEVIGQGHAGAAFHYGNPGGGGFGQIAGKPTGVPSSSWAITAPATDAARQWDGWGTALKPAWEPVIVARKPLV